MRFDALPNQDSKALGVPTVLQPRGCCKGSSSLSCCLSQLLGGPGLFTVLHTAFEGRLQIPEGTASSPGGTRTRKGNRKAPTAPVLVQDDEKNTGFFNTFLNYCNDCARSFPHFPFKRSWACYSDCINAKYSLLKKQKCPFLQCLPQ